MQLNLHNIYALNAGYDEKMDKVDIYNLALKKINTVKDAKDYINDKFGNFDGEKIVEFPELNKIMTFNLEEGFAEYVIYASGVKVEQVSWKSIALDDCSLEEFFAE